MEEGPLLMKEIYDGLGLGVSSLSAHSPLMKPEASVPQFTRAADWHPSLDAISCATRNTPDFLAVRGFKNLAATGFPFLMDAANSLPPK